MSKKRVRLTDEKAKELGLELKPHDKGRNTARYSIDDIQTLEDKQQEKQSDKPTFVLSAWSDKGRMMNIEEYCKTYELPKHDIIRYKLVSHTGTPFYNIEFKESTLDNEMDWGKVKKILTKEIKRDYTYKKTHFNFDVENVLKWSDLHFGAMIKDLLLTKDYNKDILLDGLLESVSDINAFKFKKTHVHINGDLIESFSGLNHINSWQSMDSEVIGAKAVKLCSEMLHKVLSKVNNLGCVKIVAGNHDRLSKNNDEDVKGGAADLIAYCLELMGYDVEFHPYVITHFVDGINHINLHGDKGISKKSTEKIILDYGIQGVYNLINEGHLHSVIEKLSIKQRESFEIVKDDSIMHRRFYLPSFFTGNYYSATLGFTTNPGYYSIWNKGNNRPQFFNGSV